MPGNRRINQMVEKQTLIEKIADHPVPWALAGLLVTLACIVSGVLGLVLRTPVSADSLEKAPHYGHVTMQVVGQDSSMYFELHNTFCRFLPTGREYFYRVTTKDGAGLFVRAGKNEIFAEGNDFDGRVAKFSSEEQKYLRDAFALETDCYIDLISDRLYLMRIAVGLIMLCDMVLAALMIKEKIPAGSRAYDAVNIIFCTLPVGAVVLGIHLMGFI